MSSMIKKEDIKNLAQLSRIQISETEAESLTSEIDSILAYVGRINKIGEDAKFEVPKLRNVMRDDVVEHKANEYTESILSIAPAREGNYLKVKKILE